MGTYCLVDFAIPVNNRMKIKENKKSNKYSDLARELKKAMEHKGDCDTVIVPYLHDNELFLLHRY